MSDNIIAVKKAIYQFVRTELSLGFTSYFAQPNKQIYWENTRINERGGFPYCFLEVENEEVLGWGDFNSYERTTVDEVTTIQRIDKEFNVMTVGFNFCAMRDDLDGTTPLNGLEAQGLAQRMSRLVRRKFRSDNALDWFCGQNDDSIYIGIQTQDMSPISYIPHYEETKAKHRFKFTCPFNWTDEYETDIDLALGAEIIAINDEDTSIIIP